MTKAGNITKIISGDPLRLNFGSIGGLNLEITLGCQVRRYNAADTLQGKVDVSIVKRGCGLNDITPSGCFVVLVDLIIEVVGLFNILVLCSYISRISFVRGSSSSGCHLNDTVLIETILVCEE